MVLASNAACLSSAIALNKNGHAIAGATVEELRDAIAASIIQHDRFLAQSRAMLQETRVRNVINLAIVREWGVPSRLSAAASQPAGARRLAGGRSAISPANPVRMPMNSQSRWAALTTGGWGQA